MKVADNEASKFYEEQIRSDREFLWRYAAEHLQKDNQSARKNCKVDKVGYVCPKCNSGTHAKGTGITYMNKGNFYQCHSCGEQYSVLGLIMACENKDTREAFKTALELYGYQNTKSSNQDSAGSYGRLQLENEKLQAAQKKETPKQDFTEFYKRCAARIGETDYMTKRGISQATLELYGIGYTDEPLYAYSTVKKPRIIYPCSKYSYNSRLINPSEGEGKCYKPKGIEHQIFNAACFDDAETPIFVVEGETDALSLLEIGYYAVAIGGVAGISKVIERCKQSSPSAPLIIALDNDNAGHTNAEKLDKALAELNIAHIAIMDFIDTINEKGEIMDINDLLRQDRQDLKARAEAACKWAYVKENARKEKYKTESCAGAFLSEFEGGLNPIYCTPAIPTGIEAIDTALNGGLYAGLYTIGAMSSLGKTSFVLQMVDSIARHSKHDILYFSLEMSKIELMGRSISRNTTEIALEEKRFSETGYNCSELEITNGEWYANYSADRKALIAKAIERYREYADQIYIHEGIGNIGIEQIRNKVAEHIEITGNTPVIVVDYLQIIAPPEDIRYTTDKQVIDKAVLELKRMSRDYKTPVIIISSFNRSNYKKSADMEAFKESGAIEYSCDVLGAIQPRGLEDKNGKTNENFNFGQALKPDKRQVVFKILKNRKGSARAMLQATYYAKFNLFWGIEKYNEDREAPLIPESEESEQKKAKEMFAS